MEHARKHAVLTLRHHHRSPVNEPVTVVLPDGTPISGVIDAVVTMDAQRLPVLTLTLHNFHVDIVGREPT